jgi:hypothetical protein
MAEGCETPRMATGPSGDVDRQPWFQLIDQGNTRDHNRSGGHRLAEAR